MSSILRIVSRARLLWRRQGYIYDEDRYNCDAACAHGNQTSTFTATVISNDSNGGLIDQNGNQYSASVTGAGVSFTQAGSDQFLAGHVHKRVE